MYSSESWVFVLFIGWLIAVIPETTNQNIRFQTKIASAHGPATIFNIESTSPLLTSQNAFMQASNVNKISNQHFQQLTNNFKDNRYRYNSYKSHILP